MSLFVSALTLAMACLFLGAAVQKSVDLRRFRSTLEQLGFSILVANWAATIVVLLEVLASLGLIFRPGSVLTLSGIIVLSSSFAAAGLIAKVQKRNVRCGCFGAYGSNALGAPQLWLWPAWLAAALLCWLKPPSPSTFTDKAAGFAIVCLILASTRAMTSLGSWREARADRRSAQEMYVWLHS